MAGYTRQSTANIVAGQPVNASPLAAEFNAIEAAFHASTGHAHDATVGSGPRIDLTTSVTGILPVANGGTGLSTLETLTLTSTDAGAGVAPSLVFYRNSASPLANDLGGRILWQFEDSAGNTDDAVQIHARIDDTTSTNEDYSLITQIKIAGTLTTVLTLTGLTTHRPSGSITSWDAGDVTLTHSANTLTWAGATTYVYDTDLRVTTAGTNTASVVTVGGTQTLTNKTLTSPTISGPTISGTVALASGAIFNWNSGDVTITHSANTLTFAGASSGYVFDDDILLPSGGIINFNSGDISIIHSANVLTFSGAATSYTFTEGVIIAGNGVSIAAGSLALASGTVINWNSSDVTITHSANALAFAGATSGYSFDDDILLASGSVINFNSGDVTITHAANTLTFAGATSYVYSDGFIDLSTGTSTGIKFDVNNNSSDDQTLDGYTDWITSTVTPVGFGTASSVTYRSKRIGDTLYIRCRFTAGTSTAVEARVPLELGDVALTASSAITTIEHAGSWTRSTAPGAIQGNILCEPSVGYITFGFHSAVVGGLTKQNGNGISASGDVMAFSAQVPIDGW